MDPDRQADGLGGFHARLAHSLRCRGRLLPLGLHQRHAPTELPFFARFNANNHFAPEQLNGYEVGLPPTARPRSTSISPRFYNHYHDLFSQELTGPAFLETLRRPRICCSPLNSATDCWATPRREIAPEWRPTDFWRLRGSYSYLHMDIKKAPGSRRCRHGAQDRGVEPATSGVGSIRPSTSRKLCSWISRTVMSSRFLASGSGVFDGRCPPWLAHPPAIRGSRGRAESVPAMPSGVPGRSRPAGWHPKKRLCEVDMEPMINRGADGSHFRQSCAAAWPAPTLLGRGFRGLGSVPDPSACAAAKEPSLEYR